MSAGTAGVDCRAGRPRGLDGVEVGETRRKRSRCAVKVGEGTAGESGGASSASALILAASQQERAEGRAKPTSSVLRLLTPHKDASIGYCAPSECPRLARSLRQGASIRDRSRPPCRPRVDLRLLLLPLERPPGIPRPPCTQCRAGRASRPGVESARRAHAVPVVEGRRQGSLRGEIIPSRSVCNFLSGATGP